MSRSSKQPSEQIQQPACKPAAGALDTVSTLEEEALQSIPFKWRLVLGIWAVSFAILVLYEVMVYIGKLIRG